MKKTRLNCCQCSKCEECCKPLNLKESYEEEIFCNAYKVQGKFSWFCDLLWNYLFISLIICNFIDEMAIIGFDKKLNEELVKKKLYQNIIIITIYLIFFMIFALGSYYAIWEMIKNKISSFSGSFGEIFGVFVVFPSIIAFIYFLYYIIQLIEIPNLKKNFKKIFGKNKKFFWKIFQKRFWNNHRHIRKIWNLFFYSIICFFGEISEFF